MKTLFMLACIASLSLISNEAQSVAPLYESSFQQSIMSDDFECRAMIGAGTVTGKNGSTFTIRSDDGYAYQAEVIGSYIVGDYVFHSDPIGGWVVILGHAD